MSYLVTITQEAEEDLGGIYAYITFSLLSPQNAKRQIDRIQKVIQSLDEFPMRHRLMESEPWKSRGMHVVPCDNFLIFYLVEEKKQRGCYFKDSIRKKKSEKRIKLT